MRHLFCTLLAVVLMLATALPVLALNQWTVMLYLVSDDNESTSMVESHLETINALAPKAGVAGQYEVVVMIDAPKGYTLVSKAKNPSGGFLLEPGTNGKWNIAEELGEVNMGSPANLWRFLKWATTKHPGRQTALVIAGHGSGIFSWRGTGGVNAANPGAVEFDPGRFVGYDDTDNDCLTVFEIRAVLEAARDRLNSGRPLDVLIFDSCLPGCIEALYQLRDCGKLLVSSPSTTLIGGMPYGKILRALAGKLEMGIEEFGQAVAKAYLDRVVEMGGDDEVMGVFRPAEAKTLVGPLDQLAIQLVRAREQKKLSVKNLTTFGGKNRYWDLSRILRSLADGATDLSGLDNAEAIKTLAREAAEALKASRVTTWYSGAFAENKIGGLSISWPEKDEYAKWRPFYKALDFAKDTHWDEFIDVWNGLN